MEATRLFERRKFLKIALIGVGGTIAAATAGVGYLTLTNRFRERYGKLLVFDGHLADVVHALAEASVPDAPGFPSVEQAEVVTRMDEEMFFVNDKISSDVKAGLYLLDMLPLAHGHLSRLSRMSVSERRAFLSRASHTHDDTVRVVISNLSGMMRWYYYGHPSTWKAIGYDGPFMNLPEKRSEQRVLYAQLVANATSGATT
ncbi:hypothetical protein KTE64_28945 [Burkholderia multivorans]|uniref:Gluconate 2-dehydrogenase subunit 3 family protein n=1 Tax=Burkholderia multivorans TaxID=87883 RepID=A0A2S9MLH2_9BURK|nr:hypothetical protein EGY20_06055 [Burkholderia multivorans]MBJ9625569.1 hypothetical protein [Burkholderia multivorans]MBU9145900.1 hypothetical protein [Burkholderia multivorans]MBU9435255.1 hypothetical protein [Burkholderia multivorans]MBU9516426.1 hypothetical protein [Burkholderia multivorans]